MGSVTYRVVAPGFSACLFSDGSSWRVYALTRAEVFDERIHVPNDLKARAFPTLDEAAEGVRQFVIAQGLAPS